MSSHQSPARLEVRSDLIAILRDRQHPVVQPSALLDTVALADASARPDDANGLMMLWDAFTPCRTDPRRLSLTLLPVDGVIRVGDAVSPRASAADTGYLVVLERFDHDKVYRLLPTNHVEDAADIVVTADLSFCR